ncbi:MAG: cupin domain-containing protein [Hyphomicrobiales bacterium]
MPTRRVVTGEVGGKAVFTIDETVDDIHVGLMPGAEIARVYGNNHLALPTDGRENDTHNYFPEPGGAAVYIITLPPDPKSPPAKPEAMAPLIAEVNAKLPGLLEAMSDDGSFTHRTDTVDIVTILSGRIVIELAGGASKDLNPGDVVIQNGTRHRWRNPYDAPCTLHTVSIGVARSSAGDAN